MCVDPILWNCVGFRSYDFSRVWWVSGWEGGPPPRRPRTNIWTFHTPLESWNLGLSRDVRGVQIFVRGRRVAEEWCGPWCSDPTIYDVLTRLSFSLTRMSTPGYFDLRWGPVAPKSGNLVVNHLDHLGFTPTIFQIWESLVANNLDYDDFFKFCVLLALKSQNLSTKLE